MGGTIQNTIQSKIQSLKTVTNIQYERPDKNKVKEYHSRLLKNQEALLYLLRDRKLDIKTIKYFRLGLSEENRLAIPIYKKGELIDIKYRTIPPEPKAFFRERNTETWIFNGDQGLKEGIKRGEIIVTEGEIDAMSLYEAGFKNVISLVAGAQSVGPWIIELDKIKKIIVNFDSDETGQTAARNFANRLGLEKCINVKLPAKDANEFFLKYNAKDYQNILTNSDKFPIEDVVRLKDYFEEIRENKKYVKDFKFCYPKLDALTGGFNRSNVIILAADSGHGKSSMMFNVATKLCQNNCPTMYVPLEDNPRYVARRILNILAGMEVSRLLNKDWDVLKKKILNLPLYIYIGQEKFDLDTFHKIIEVGRKVYDIQIFVLDHIHFLAKRGRDLTEEVSHIMRELVTICRLYDVAIFGISHIKRKMGNEPWTRMPHIDTLKESSSLKQDAHMVLMLFQEPEPVENNIILELAVQKNREGAKTIGDKYLTYTFDLESSIINEVENKIK